MLRLLPALAALFIAAEAWAIELSSSDVASNSTIGDKPHRHIFRVFALKVDKLPLTKKSPGAMLGFDLNA